MGKTGRKMVQAIGKEASRDLGSVQLSDRNKRGLEKGETSSGFIGKSSLRSASVAAGQVGNPCVDKACSADGSVVRAGDVASINVGSSSASPHKAESCGKVSPLARVVEIDDGNEAGAGGVNSGKGRMEKTTDFGATSNKNDDFPPLQAYIGGSQLNGRRECFGHQACRGKRKMGALKMGCVEPIGATGSLGARSTETSKNIEAAPAVDSPSSKWVDGAKPAMEKDMSLSQNAVAQSTIEANAKGTAPPRLFASLFKNNRNILQAERLSIHEDVVKGRVKIRKEDVIDKLEEWRAVLIGVVAGTDVPFHRLKHYVAAAWRVPTPRIFQKSNGVFVFRFQQEEARDWVLRNGPWNVDGSRPLILKCWNYGQPIEWSVFDRVPAWVCLPDLDPTLFTNAALSRLGCAIGKPLCLDERTAKGERISYARMLVEVSVDDALAKYIEVEDVYNKVYNQKIIFEWLPAVCIECRCFGHVSIRCPSAREKACLAGRQVWVPKSLNVNENSDKLIAAGCPDGTLVPTLAAGKSCASSSAPCRVWLPKGGNANEKIAMKIMPPAAPADCAREKMAMTAKEGSMTADGGSTLVAGAAGLTSKMRYGKQQDSELKSKIREYVQQGFMMDEGTELDAESLTENCERIRCMTSTQGGICMTAESAVQQVVYERNTVSRAEEHVCMKNERRVQERALRIDATAAVHAKRTQASGNTAPRSSSAKQRSKRGKAEREIKDSYRLLQYLDEEGAFSDGWEGMHGESSDERDYTEARLKKTNSELVSTPLANETSNVSPVRNTREEDRTLIIERVTGRVASLGNGFGVVYKNKLRKLNKGQRGSVRLMLHSDENGLNFGPANQEEHTNGGSARERRLEDWFP